uniref:TPM_phosphatase domain-containing protein n=1 Tax=Macrostomum lignano TaxID=282301 RepID=A0A1I8FQC7_9PLAT
SRSRSRADQLRSPTHRQQPGPDPQTAQSRAAGLEPSLYRRTASASTRVLTNSANATASGRAAMTATAGSGEELHPKRLSPSPPSPMSAAPRWPPVACRFSRRPPTAAGCTRACRPAASGGSVSPDSVASSEWTAARLTRSSSTFAGLFVGVGGRQCAAAVAALAADYAAAELASNSPIEARDAARSLLRQFDWSDNERLLAVIVTGPGEDAAAVDAKRGRPAAVSPSAARAAPVRARGPGLHGQGRLADRQAAAGANSQPDADCTTADRLCQAMIRLDAICAARLAATACDAAQPLADQQTIENGSGSRRVLAASMRPGIRARLPRSEPSGLVQLKWPKERLNSWDFLVQPASRHRAARRRDDRPSLTARPNMRWPGVGGQLLAAQSGRVRILAEKILRPLWCRQLAESCGHMGLGGRFNEATGRTRRCPPGIVLLLHLT